MERRQFVKASLISAGSILGIGAGTYTLIEKVTKDTLTIAFAIKVLDKLSQEKSLSLGTWDPYQIFTHCAQSVEFSMFGFPEHKSNFFKNTVGTLAFSIFSSKGKMTHSLHQPIPGAPSLIKNSNSINALNRLKKSLIEFDNYHGTLAPHFAYGELSKEEYETAHVMHLYNHLQEIHS